MDTIIQPVIHPSKRGRYRHHTDEFKRAVVAQSLRGDSSVARVAREHNINANQVFTWRKQFGEVQPSAVADACTFLPVALATAPVAPPANVDEPQTALPGVIELSIGQAQLRLEGTVDMAALTLVLQRLLP